MVQQTSQALTIAGLAGAVAMLAGFIGLIIFPIVFNFFVIPKIEKKIGKKLEFSYGIYDFYLFGAFFLKYMEVAYYISARCLGIKLFPVNSKTALLRINYDVKTASKTEIFWSFAVLVNMIVFIISVVVGIHYLN